MVGRLRWRGAYGLLGFTPQVTSHRGKQSRGLLINRTYPSAHSSMARFLKRTSMIETLPEP